ncbi:hypothetical protein A4X06_0g5664 [Tilletia controversa]|uniref:Uncharacterized protein n=1 Tax=Tilletia controversa TaxID=13291 RepID=A0A8X7MQ31_9BASI|nr:hypothetical protein A4X06_0g5664 [Tilletia controversa]CAD7067553.1 unnamed protein product [Tilletia caries]
MHCYSLTKARPDLLITVFEASVSPGGGCSLGGQLMRLNALNLRKLKHMGAPDMNNSKTLVTSNTREVFAGMICGGMELAELDGLPRMDASSTASSEQASPVLRAYFFLRQLKTKGAEDDIQWYVSEF